MNFDTIYALSKDNAKALTCYIIEYGLRLEKVKKSIAEKEQDTFYQKNRSSIDLLLLPKVKTYEKYIRILSYRIDELKEIQRKKDHRTAVAYMTDPDNAYDIWRDEQMDLE